MMVLVTMRMITDMIVNEMNEGDDVSERDGDGLHWVDGWVVAFCQNLSPEVVIKSLVEAAGIYTFASSLIIKIHATKASQYDYS